jgi:hypothetical protein
MQLVAGTDSVGFTGDNGPATLAEINAIFPFVDSNGNIYIATFSDHRVRKVSPTGIIVTFAGTGNSSLAGIGGSSNSVSFNTPYCVVGDTAGTVLYISDTRYVWKYVFLTNIMSIFAQSTTLNRGFSGDTGPATSSQLDNISGLWLTTAGDLYITDYANNRIRKVVATGSIISTVAGSSGPIGFSGDSGPATLATLYGPCGVYVDINGRLFIADHLNNRIRKVSSISGIISTFAGSGVQTPFNGDNMPATSANINRPMDVKGDSLGNIFISEYGSCVIRMVDFYGIISTVFGTFDLCDYSGPGITSRTSAIFNPRGLWIDSLGTLYFSDQNTIHRGVLVSSPTSQPSGKPSSQPMIQPSRQPTGQPTSQPTKQPSARPSEQPSLQPSSRPTSQPSKYPSSRPSTQPSSEPSVPLVVRPSSRPTCSPSVQPSSQPSLQPVSSPSDQPTAQPTDRPSAQPTASPSNRPSSKPSTQPSCVPSVCPSNQPSSRPSHISTAHPSSYPSSSVPSNEPTSRATELPTSQPSLRPSAQPSSFPSTHPSSVPTIVPSTQPSCRPSCSPSSQPSSVPSAQPSSFPTGEPSVGPFSQPSSRPSRQPTCFSLGKPTRQPTSSPSTLTTVVPSIQKSSFPTFISSSGPTNPPTSVLQSTCLPTDAIYRSSNGHSILFPF